MNFQQGDILVKNSCIWLSERIIKDVGLFTEGYIRKIRTKYRQSVQPCYRHHNILPDTGKSWRWAKINHGYYYDLKRIPNRKPTFYRDLFGDPDALVASYELAMNSQESDLLTAELTNFVNKRYKHHLQNYQDCTTVQRVGLAKACAVLEFTIDYKELLELKGNKIYKDICAIIEQKDMCYIPKNYRKFKEKIDAILGGEDLTEVIKLPRSGNNNALIFDDPELEAAALKLRSYKENFTNEYIIRKIQELCKIKGRRVPGRRWFGQKVFEQQQTKFLTDHLRYGTGTSKAFKNTGYIPLARALYAGDCWEVDATRINLIAHNKEDKTQDCLNIVAVKDAHSGDILGYAFDYSENRYVYANALKMAIENTQYLPYELIVDRFPGHNTNEIKTLFSHMEALGVKINITSSPNGKPNVERGFGTLQSVFMQESKYYYGEGVKSRRDAAHRSPEYLKEIRKQAKKKGDEYFDLTAAYNESTTIVEAFRNTPMSAYSRKHAKIDKSPKMIHDASEKPNIKKMKPHQISMLFGLKKKTTIKHDGMIKTEIHNAEYFYHVEDYEVMKKHKNVIMSYDLEDLNKVHLFRKEEDMLIHITEAKLFNTPQIRGAKPEWDRLALEKQRLKDIAERKKIDLEEQIQAFNEVDLLMGRFTNKETTGNRETNRILQDTRYDTMKRTANSDVHTEDGSDIDLDSFLNAQL